VCARVCVLSARVYVRMCVCVCVYVCACVLVYASSCAYLFCANSCACMREEGWALRYFAMSGCHAVNRCAKISR